MLLAYVAIVFRGEVCICELLALTYSFVFLLLLSGQQAWSVWKKEHMRSTYAHGNCHHDKFTAAGLQ